MVYETSVDKILGHKDSQINMRTSNDTSMDIEFKNITYTVTVPFPKKDKKTILKDISGYFRSGELIAIMGPSGSGKSSLLNVLTGFSTQGVTGMIRIGDSIRYFNNKQKKIKAEKEYMKKSCYILQDDRLNPLFTVMELMKFSADMKLGNSYTEKMKSVLISQILESLGLSNAEHTRCGNLSGGQKKRLSIAVELINNPSVIFLDEPTTGLDSLSSTQCIEMLKQLTIKGHTVVCTIHQPSASIYTMFDQVYVLADGLCIYNGSSDNTVPYFSSLGLSCPKYHNPADFMLEVANGEYGKFNDVLSNKSQKENWLKNFSPATLPACSGCIADSQNVFSLRHELYKFKMLAKRCVTQHYRDWTISHLRVALHLLIGIVLGSVFQQAGMDASKTYSNMGYLIISIVYISYTSMMPAVLKFPSEISVLKKEIFNNWYNIKTYYIAVMITGMPFQICYCFAYSVPSYLLTSQPEHMWRFAMFVLVLLYLSLVSDAIGNVIGTCCNPINGTFFAAILICALLAFTGFLAQLADMHPLLRSVTDLSLFKYAFEGLILALYSYGRKPLWCPETKLFCFLSRPKKVITFLSFKSDNFWTDVAVLLVSFIIFRIIAYFTLKKYLKRSTE